MTTKSNLSYLVAYCFLYTATIICNKYVLTYLGFQFPTIFQAWQAFVAILLIQAISGNILNDLSISNTIPWVPAMLFYVGSIYSGSKALAHLPVPVFLLSHGASDVILILFDRYFPANAVHFSIPLKMSGMFFAIWSTNEDRPSPIDWTWIVMNTICSGAYRTVSFWYATYHKPFCSLSVIQRQYLNNLLSFIIFFPLAIFLGHHRQVQNNFPYLGETRFYIGCIFSGILGWGLNYIWGKVNTPVESFHVQMVQLGAKTITILFSFQLFPVSHSSPLWAGIFLGIFGDILQILGNMFVHASDYGHDISDVLIGS